MFALVLAVAALGGPTRPEASHADDEALPSGADILDRYAEAVGGRAAYDKIHNRVTKGTLAFAQSTVTGVLITYQARPSKQYALLEGDVLGKIQEGTDGDIVWEIAELTGPRIKEDDERALTLREAVLDREVRWRDFYSQAESTGVDTVGGKPCYRVVVTTKDGRTERHCYERDSALLVKVGMSIKDESGTTPIQIFPGDYQRVDGILVPHRTRWIWGWQAMTFTIESLQHNVEMPPDRFEIPDDIRALLSKSPPQ